MLETFTLEKITISTVLDTRRSKNSGLFPIKYRINYMQKQTYYPAGIDLSVDQWNRLPKAKGDELKQVRELLQAGFDKIKLHVIEMVKGDGFSVEQLNNRLSRGMRNSIISAFNDRIETLKKNEKFGSAQCYDYSLRSLLKFTGKDLKFSEITVSWLSRFEKFLIDEGKSYTTVAIYMRSIQAIINEGKKQGVISLSQYPFGKDKYQIPQTTSRKMALNLPQIGKVVNFPLITETSKMYRDLWFFSYLCNGINIIDLLHLKYSNIANNKIHFFRIKTIARSKKKKEIVAIMLPEMQKIIDRWGNPKNPNSYIFPFLKDGLTLKEERRIVGSTTGSINNRMKKIGKALGYGNISTYTSRHSYATVQKRGGTGIAFISESLGHSDIKVTENYLDSFEDETRFKNAELLTKF